MSRWSEQPRYRGHSQPRSPPVPNPDYRSSQDRYDRAPNPVHHRPREHYRGYDLKDSGYPVSSLANVYRKDTRQEQDFNRYPKDSRLDYRPNDPKYGRPGQSGYKPNDSYDAFLKSPQPVTRRQSRVGREDPHITSQSRARRTQEVNENGGFKEPRSWLDYLNGERSQGYVDHVVWTRRSEQDESGPRLDRRRHGDGGRPMEYPNNERPPGYMNQARPMERPRPAYDDLGRPVRYEGQHRPPQFAQDPLPAQYMDEPRAVVYVPDPRPAPYPEHGRPGHYVDQGGPPHFVDQNRPRYIPQNDHQGRPVYGPPQPGQYTNQNDMRAPLYLDVGRPMQHLDQGGPPYVMDQPNPQPHLYPVQGGPPQYQDQSGPRYYPEEPRPVYYQQGVAMDDRYPAGPPMQYSQQGRPVGY